MKTLRLDLKRAISRRSFWFTVLLTMAVLWIGLGPQTAYLLSDIITGYRPPWNYLLYNTLRSSTSALTLPALVALPYALNEYMELQTGYFRYALIRSCRSNYCYTKVFGCLFASVVAQSFALILAVGLGIFFGNFDVGYVNCQMLSACVLARLLCTGIWSSIAGASGMLTRITSAVFLVPLAISYTLSMLGRRLLSQIPWLDPSSWLTGETQLLPLLLLLVCTSLHFLAVWMEVQKRG